ncbi:unnamed protein product, partial [marine sediment metagenome]
TDVKPKELEKKGKKGSGSIPDIIKINEMFDSLVGNDVAKYESVFGKGSVEVALMKKKILKKLGLQVEGKGLGGIEVSYYKWLHGATTAKKWGRKITRETRHEEMHIRKKKIKDYEQRLEKEWKENSMDESITENSDTVEKVEKSKRAERSQVEKEMSLSTRKVDRDGTKAKLDQVAKEYGTEVTNGKWEAPAKKHMTSALWTAKKVLNVMKELRVEPAKMTKIQNTIETLRKHLEDGNAITHKEFEKLTNRIVDQTTGFSSKM